MITTDKDMYKILRGMKTLQRQYRKEGQSEWYYLDPRGARTIADMGEIDVESEYAPNPYAREILLDDMRRHEEDYYIWRTMEDEKVRDSHAVREGKVYNWNLPPEGGHPGEDHNCRCWAEPFEAEKMSGIDISDIIRCLKKGTIDYSLYGDDFSREFIDQMENDEEFKKILNEYIIPNEGGFSDKKNDRGGKTKFGISQKVYKNEDIKNLTRERANAIIYRDFYIWNGLNKLPYTIRGFIVDYGMPTSPLNAIQTVHKVLGLPAKGNIIGKNTLSKLEKFSKHDYEEFLANYQKEMLEYYKNIVQKDSSQINNLAGWINRANRAHLAK